MREFEGGGRGSEEEKKPWSAGKRGVNGVKRWLRSERKGCLGVETLLVSTEKRVRKPSSLPMLSLLLSLLPSSPPSSPPPSRGFYT